MAGFVTESAFLLHHTTHPDNGWRTLARCANACALRVVLDSVTELRSTVQFRLSKQRTTLHRIISQCHGFLTVPHTFRLPLKSAKCLPFPLPLAAVKELILEHRGGSKRVSENQLFWILKYNDFCVDTPPIEKGSLSDTRAGLTKWILHTSPNWKPSRLVFCLHLLQGIGAN